MVQQVNNFVSLICPNCKKDNNLIIFIDFKNKKPELAICLKRYFKPSLARKHGIPTTGCGFKFKLKSIKIAQNKLIKSNPGLFIREIKTTEPKPI